MNVCANRKLFRGLSAAILTLVLLAGASAFAKGSSSSSSAAKWVILPLVVVGGENNKDSKQYLSTFESEVSKSGIDRASPKQVSAFLSQEPGCVRKDECLGKLAKALHAERVLLVTISPFSKEMVLTAKIVGANGSVLNESASTINRAPNEPALSAAKDAFEVLLSDLQSEPTPLTPPVAEQTPAKGNTNTSQGTTSSQASAGQTSSGQTSTSSGFNTSQGNTSAAQATTSSSQQQQNQQVANSLKTPPPAPPAPTGSWKTPAGIGIGVAGIALLGGGTFFGIKSSADWNRADAYYANSLGLAFAKDVPAIQRYEQSAQMYQALSITGFVAGALAVGGGGFLILTDKRQPEGPRISMRVAITPSAGALVVQFP